MSSTPVTVQVTVLNQTAEVKVEPIVTEMTFAQGTPGPAGIGVPGGGTTGQYLRKTAATDFSTAWDTITAADISGLAGTLESLQTQIDAKADDPHGLNTHSDVNIIEKVTGEVLRWNGAFWASDFLNWSDLRNLPSSFTPSAHILSLHTDVAFGSQPESGEFLRHDGTQWTNQTVSLTSFIVGTPSIGQVIRWNGSIWQPVTLAHTDISDFDAEVGALVVSGIAAADLDNLSDVILLDPANGQYLRYSGGAWRNAALSTSDITSGTLADARLSSNVTLAGNTFNGANQLVELDSSGRLPAIDGSLLTNLPAGIDSLGELTDVNFGSVPESGEFLRHDGTQWTNQSVSLSVFLTGTPTSGQYPRFNGSVWVPDTLTHADLSDFDAEVQALIDASAKNSIQSNSSQFQLVGDSASPGGTKLYGTDGFGTKGWQSFPGLNALSDVTLLSPSAKQVLQYNNGTSRWENATFSATDITTGTLADARLTANVTLEGNTFNGANQLVQLDGSARLPAVDGSLLTNLPSGSSTLGGLTDVTLTTPATNAVLKYDGAEWIDGSVAYSELTGVPSDFTPSAHTHTASEVTDFDTAADARIAAAVINDLSNVVTTPSTGHVLYYTGTQWSSTVLTHTFISDFDTEVNALIAAASITMSQISDLFADGAKNSIQVDATDLQLVGDSASPGGTKLYGTDGFGTKGWQSFPGLNALADVTLLSESANQVLQYNNGLGVWQNATLTASDISDFNTAADARIGAASIADLSDVSGVGTTGQFLKNAAGTFSPANLAASDIQSGTFADARISESSVTQHEAALTILETQITDGTALRRFTDTERLATLFLDNGASAVGTGNPRAKRMLYPGQISGVSFSLQASDTGTATVRVKNDAGTNTSVGTADISADNSAADASITWSTGTGSFSAGDRIEIEPTSGFSTATWAEITAYGTRSS